MKSFVLFIVVVVFLACSATLVLGNGEPVCTASGCQWYPMITYDQGAIIAWLDDRNGNWEIYVAKPRGYWNAYNGVAASVEGQAERDVVLVGDGLGGAFIAWADSRGDDQDIYMQKIDWMGYVKLTPGGFNICPAPGDQQHPKIISDGDGGAIIVWQDTNVPDGGIYAQRLDTNGYKCWIYNAPVCGCPGSHSYPNIATDGSGGAIIVWSDDRVGHKDLYAQRIDSNGSALWATNGVAICTAAGDQENLYRNRVVIPDGNGGAVITWNDGRSGASTRDIYAQKIDASGAVQWTTNGVAICTESGDQRHPDMTADGFGGYIVSWQDIRSSSSCDVYAQKINSAGSVEWATDGVAICTNAYSSSLAADGKGGAIIVWKDYRTLSGDEYDIYAQTVNSYGQTVWQDQGIPVCTAIHNQAGPMIVADGMGDAYISWFDARTSNYFDIYYTKINTGPVATTLASYSASLEGSAVDITWRLSEAGDDMKFFILRKADNQRAFTEIDNPDIVSDDLSFRYSDAGVQPGNTYLYRVDVKDEEERRTLFETESISVPALKVALYQNSPNPFSSATGIRYYIPERTRVTLDVYDVKGRRVARLVDKFEETGHHAAEWDGRDARGNPASSGIFMCVLKAGVTKLTHKMILVR